RNDAYVPGTPCAPDRQNGTWIVQAHEWGKYVGRADFVIDGGRIELVKYALLPVNMKKTGPDRKKVLATELIQDDTGMKAFLQPFQDNGQARLSVPVGSADGLFDGDRDRVRKQ